MSKSLKICGEFVEYYYWSFIIITVISHMGFERINPSTLCDDIEGKMEILKRTDIPGEFWTFLLLLGK